MGPYWWIQTQNNCCPFMSTTLDRIETDTAVPGKQAYLQVQYFYRYERSQLHWCIWPPNLVNFKFLMVKTDVSSNYESPKLHISVSLLSFNASLKWHSFKWLHKNEEVLTITHWISWFLCLGMMAGLQSMDLHNQLALHLSIAPSQLPQLCQTAYDLSHTSVKKFLCAHFSFLSMTIQTKMQP